MIDYDFEVLSRDFLKAKNRKVAFVSGHLDVTKEEFEEHYAPLIYEAVKKGHSFVVGLKVTRNQTLELSHILIWSKLQAVCTVL